MQEYKRPSLGHCPKMPPALGVPEECGVQWRDGANGLSLDSGPHFTAGPELRGARNSPPTRDTAS